MWLALACPVSSLKIVIQVPITYSSATTGVSHIASYSGRKHFQLELELRCGYGPRCHLSTDLWSVRCPTHWKGWKPRSGSHLYTQEISAGQISIKIKTRGMGLEYPACIAIYQEGLFTFVTQTLKPSPKSKWDATEGCALFQSTPNWTNALAPSGKVSTGIG